MTIRLRVIIILAILCAALIACALVAHRRNKESTHGVHIMLLALLPPIIGNIIIIASQNELFANIGCYLYFIGLDWTVIVLLLFTTSYCHFKSGNYLWFKVLLGIVVLDTIQLLLNPITHHAFTLEPIMVDEAVYYSLIPMIGQVVHRVVAYGIFFVSVGIFVYKTFTVSRINVERYLVILVSMIFAGAWETYYIFSGSPVDRSMIAFGIFGLLLFYFTMYYKPYRLLDRMLARVVTTLDEMVLFFDAEDTCIYANTAAKKSLGLKEGDEGLRGVHRVVEGYLNQPIMLDKEWRMKRQVRYGGETRHWVFEARIVSEVGEKPYGCVLSIRDVTEEENKLAHEQNLARYDQLTGIYNKQYLYDQAETLICENPDTKWSVIALDVKDFKIINDIFSNELGDEVLKRIADLLRKGGNVNCAYGRISGDKFGYVIPSGDFNAARTEELLLGFRFVEQGINHPIVIHAGVYEVEKGSIPISVMFDRAFMALATIKNDYERRLAYYDDEMRERVIWNQSISNALEGAIATGQIRPYLQPLVDANGNVEGAEALVRWIHPREGYLSPARFIPVFESNGMIARLDKYMWECACRILKDWERRGIDLFISVNISPKDFYFIDVYGTIRELVSRYEIKPEKLRLEITETVMMSNIENRLRIIDDLRSDGFIIEMDDFGSGYSSLNLLKDMPVDVLKIDMAFLYKTKDMLKAQKILQMIIDLSSRIGIRSITEGVETESQLEMLVQMGCGMFQGYYFAKPMPLEEFESKYQSVFERT